MRGFQADLAANSEPSLPASTSRIALNHHTRAKYCSYLLITCIKSKLLKEKTANIFQYYDIETVWYIVRI